MIHTLTQELMTLLLDCSFYILLIIDQYFVLSKLYYNSFLHVCRFTDSNKGTLTYHTVHIYTNNYI